MLISGGGNDILDDHLATLVRNKQGHPQQYGRELIVQTRLRSVLDELDIAERDEQQDVVNGLIDAFNDRLHHLESTVQGFVHVDVRNLLGPGDWDDEIHPAASARRRLAAHFRRVLVNNTTAAQDPI